MSGADNAGRAAFVATLGAALMIAHQVAAKATRDALFLSVFRAESLPAMYIGAALFSIALVLPASRVMAVAGPARVVPGAFCASGVLHLAEWVLVLRAPTLVAVALYLHFAGLGAVLISGFWSMVNERFDPRTAKKRMGQIGAGGSLGALFGGALGLSLRRPDLMLPILCAMHLLCAWTLTGLRARAGRAGRTAEEPAGGLGEGTRLLAKLAYLRYLAFLVLLGAASATMIDQVFKAQAQAAFAPADLLRFFALFYTAASLIGCVIQVAVTRLLLENSGLGVTVGVLPATVTLGSLGAALVPGLPGAAFARGCEQVVHNSLFRSGYELFYTSVPPTEKRSAKQIIDVGCDRLGDMVGAVVSRCLLWAAPGAAQPAMLGAAAGAGLLGIWVARRLDRGYVAALERSLRDRAVELKLEDVEDQTTRATLMLTLAGLRAGPELGAKGGDGSPPAPLDPLLRRIGELCSGDAGRVRRALREGALTSALAAHAIPLLAWDEIAEEAIRALRRAGPGIGGQLIDAMLDSEQDFAVRRRIPGVLSAFPSARALEGLFLGLNDKRFEVRFRCGRGLATLLDQEPGLSLAADQVFQAVTRELELGRRLWENHRLLDGCEEDDLVGERVNRGLQHVFTLLSLILPKEPLRLSLAALHTDDEMLRGTALEYLETVLPPPVRERLWPLVDEDRPAGGARRSREEVLEALLQSHESIQVRLQQLRAKKPPPA